MNDKKEREGKARNLALFCGLLTAADQQKPTVVLIHSTQVLLSLAVSFFVPVLRNPSFLQEPASKANKRTDLSLSFSSFFSSTALIQPTAHSHFTVPYHFFILFLAILHQPPTLGNCNSLLHIFPHSTDQPTDTPPTKRQSWNCPLSESTAQTQLAPSLTFSPSPANTANRSTGMSFFLPLEASRQKNEK